MHKSISQNVYQQSAWWKRGLSVVRRTKAISNVERQRGVSLTELMVALGIFLLFSSVFTASVMQYLRSTSSTAVRAQSASTVMMATQRLERFVTYSSSIGYATTGGTSGSKDNNTVLIYSAPSAGNDSGAAGATDGQCIMLYYKPATWSSGSLQDTGTLYYQTADVDINGKRGSYSTRHALLNSITNAPSATGLSKSDLLTVKSTDTLQFSPVVGQYSGSKLVTSNTPVMFTSRNSMPASSSSPSPSPSSPSPSPSSSATETSGASAITYKSCQ